MTHRIPLYLAFALSLALTSGCSTAARLAQPLKQAGAALFTSATFSDLKLTGIKTGPVIPVQAAAEAPNDTLLDDSTRQSFNQLLNQGTVGVLLPITQVGATAPWWIFCPAGDLQAQCEAIPANARVSFSGQPLGHGTLLLPSRLTWTAQ